MHRNVNMHNAVVISLIPRPWRSLGMRLGSDAVSGSFNHEGMCLELVFNLYPYSQTMWKAPCGLGMGLVHLQ